MTVLEIINRVLRRLREDVVASLVETDYSTMLVDLLHDAHQSVMAAHDWSALEHVVDVPVDAAQRTLDLTRLEADGGDILAGGRVTTNESFLIYGDDGRPQAWMFESSSDTDGDKMTYVSPQVMESLYQQDRDQTMEEPLYFTLRMSPDRDGLQLQLYPTPDSACHMRIRFWTPEDEIDIAADTNRTLLVPARPVMLSTLMLALNERGEELGEPGNVAERRAYDALSTAIEADTNRRGLANVYEARRE